MPFPQPAPLAWLVMIVRPSFWIVVSLTLCVLYARAANLTTRPALHRHRVWLLPLLWAAALAAVSQLFVIGQSLLSLSPSAPGPTYHRWLSWIYGTITLINLGQAGCSILGAFLLLRTFREMSKGVQAETAQQASPDVWPPPPNER